MRYDLDGYGYRGPRGGEHGPMGGPRERWFQGRRAGGPDRPDRGRRGPAGYAADYWWLGEREMDRHGHSTGYDERYRNFSEAHRPRFSPVGGMYPAMGGRYLMRRGPRPLREPTRFSEWTRWF